MDIILKKSIISEKSMKLAKQGLYTFLVDKFARKKEIKKAAEDQFGVNVVSLKTANFKGEVKLQRNRRKQYTTSQFKKAWIRLKTGQGIDLFVSEPSSAKSDDMEEIKEKKSFLKGTKVRIEKKKGNKNVG